MFGLSLANILQANMDLRLASISKEPEAIVATHPRHLRWSSRPATPKEEAVTHRRQVGLATTFLNWMFKH